MTETKIIMLKTAGVLAGVCRVMAIWEEEEILVEYAKLLAILMYDLSFEILYLLILLHIFK